VQDLWPSPQLGTRLLEKCWPGNCVQSLLGRTTSGSRVRAGSGYLLKDRVHDPAVLADALQRVHAGDCVIDPAIVSQLLGRSRVRGPLDELSEREREILALMAEGHSNRSICARLVISPRTVESHVRSVFIKLGIPESPDSSRRVLAVLAFLQA
jgi:DNA-binding NarL/FixJ family response regulator